MAGGREGEITNTPGRTTQTELTDLAPSLRSSPALLTHLAPSSISLLPHLGPRSPDLDQGCQVVERDVCERGAAVVRGARERPVRAQVGRPRRVWNRHCRRRQQDSRTPQGIIKGLLHLQPERRRAVPPVSLELLQPVHRPSLSSDVSSLVTLLSHSELQSYQIAAQRYRRAGKPQGPNVNDLTRQLTVSP